MDNQNLRLSADTLKQFQTAAIIRDAFFSGGNQIPQVRFDLKPRILDGDVAAFRLEMEGQELTYSHGPTRSETLMWPGTEPNTGVRLTFQSLDSQIFSTSEEGPWAWFRTLDKADIKRTGAGNHYLITFYVSGYAIQYDLRMTSVHHPIRLKALTQFRCPESL
jgi:type VI secretion system protein ImpL